MGVYAKGESYRCEICGNEVVEEVSGATLVCCDQEMTLIDKN